MATTLGFKDLIDLPEWRPLAVSLNNSGTGVMVAFDGRNSADANPNIYYIYSNSNLARYSKTADCHQIQSQAAAVGGGSGVNNGTMSVFVPSHGPSGTVGGTPSTTGFTMAALPNSSSVGINQLANSGAGLGFKIRVKDNGAGGSGKTEETYIVGNTSGTTPVLTLSPALTFTPVANSTYELLSGRVYFLGAGALTSGSWRCYDVATDSFANLTNTNLAATIGTATAWVMLDELYVPYNRNPGEGLVSGGATYSNGALNCIQGTAADGTHITGSGMPAGLLANEFTNFQVRIVQDATTPTAVGQRRRISAHGSGATGQFTVATWGVTPSAVARFVVEANNDLLLWTNNAVTTYSYQAGAFVADGSWSTISLAGTSGAAQYANITAAVAGGGMGLTSLSIVPDSSKNARNSHVQVFKGSATTLYQLDIANGANGTWSTQTYYGSNLNNFFSAGSSGVADMATNQGRYFYINQGNASPYRYDLLNRVLESWANLRYGSGNIGSGVQQMAVWTFIDGSTKISMLMLWRSSNAEWFQCLIQR